MKKKPHILVIASALDIQRKLTMSWKWWSLLKGLWGEGAELTVLPFEGKSVETPWWRSQPRAELQSSFWRRYFSADEPRKDEWAALLQRLLHEYPETRTVLYLGVPLTFFGAVAREIYERSAVKQIYVDGEAAEYLERVEADAAHLECFEHVFTTQPGHQKLYLGLGAKKAHLFPWWSDPDFFKQLDNAGAPLDLMIWGQADEAVRPVWAQSLVFEPLREQAKWKVASVGGGFVWPRDLVPRLNKMDQPEAPDFSSLAQQALVHVNLVESLHQEIDGLALGRLVDLACMGVCVVTHPFRGLDSLFKAGDEILVAASEAEAKKLLSRARKVMAWRNSIAAAARRRVLKNHTAQQRAKTLMRVL